MFKHAVAMITDVIEDAFRATGYTAADIDWFVPHQANKRIIDDSAHKLGIAPEKVVITVDLHGNTSAASIPLALNVAVEGRPHQEGRSRPAGSHGRRLHLGIGADPLVTGSARFQAIFLAAIPGFGPGAACKTLAIGHFRPLTAQVKLISLEIQRDMVA